MEASFWHQRWAQGDIGFHQREVNPFLAAHFNKLNLAENSRVFLPLCGKTLDFYWLLAHGYRVVGAELSELAIKELFKALALKPEITTIGNVIHYIASNIDIFVGDIFDVTAPLLGPINAIYDRAALVAMPANIRPLYASHLMNITNHAPQLLISYEYGQSVMEGPPFSVNTEEVKQLYSDNYQLQCVEHKDVEGGLKGKVASAEAAWLLQKKQRTNLNSAFW